MSPRPWEGRPDTREQRKSSLSGVLTCGVWLSLRVWCAFLSNSGLCFLVYFICSRTRSPRHWDVSRETAVFDCICWFSSSCDTKLITCSRLSVSEDDRKSERTTSGISCLRDPHWQRAWNRVDTKGQSYPVECCSESVEEYSEGKIHKSEPEPGDGNVNTVYFIHQVRGNSRISRTEFVYDERARDCKCLLILSSSE